MSCQPVTIATGAVTSSIRASKTRSRQYSAPGETSRSHSWKNGTVPPVATRSASPSGRCARPAVSRGWPFFSSTCRARNGTVCALSSSAQVSTVSRENDSPAYVESRVCEAVTAATIARRSSPASAASAHCTKPW